MKVKYKSFAVVLRYQEVGVSTKYYDVMLEAWGRMEFSSELIHDVTKVIPGTTPMKKLEKLVKEAEVIPKWYGFAYRDFNRDVYVAYPIPINLIVAGSRWLSAKVKFEWPHMFNDKWEGTLRNGFKEGFNYGHVQGFIDGYKLTIPSDDEVKATAVAINHYKDIYGPVESDLIVELKLKKKAKITNSTSVDMSKLQNSKPDLSGVANVSDIKVHYESPEKNWTVVGSAKIPTPSKLFEMPDIYPSEIPEIIAKQVHEKITQIENKNKEEAAKLKHQILAYLKQQINNNPNPYLVQQSMHAAKIDLHMTDDELLKAINEFSDK